MELTFYGVFGSIPRPIRNQDLDRIIQMHDIKAFGGNTTCLEVRTENGEEYIFDGGTGIRELGLDLMGKGYAFGQEGSAKIFLTHEHWDHIQGLPFFVPAFIPTNRIVIYGEAKVNRDIKSILEGQMEAPYFPVPLALQRGFNEFVDIEPGEVVENGVTISSMRSNHPNNSLIYSISEGDKKAIFATDYEHDGQILRQKFGPSDKELIAFSQGADVLIFDGQYTAEEYIPLTNGQFNKQIDELERHYQDEKTGRRYVEMGYDERKLVLMREVKGSKIGWGHSTYEKAIDIGLEAGVRKIVITHHDPSHRDKDLVIMYATALDYLRKRDPNGKMELAFAYDGMQMKL